MENLDEEKLVALQSELSTLRRSNAGLRSVNVHRGQKIKELEARIAELHTSIKELESLVDVRHGEMEALRKSYALLAKDNLRLEKELRAERQKSIWEHIFGK